MSDISIEFSLIDWIVVSPILGWPGLIVGALLGALLWKRRRFWGGVLGAILGNFLVFGLRLMAL